MDKETGVSMFADDLGTWNHGTSREEVKHMATIEANKIKQWADTWQMTLNLQKCEVMVFSTKKSDLDWQPDITIGDTILPTVKEARFLGIQNQGNLCFSSHIENIKAKCIRRTNILGCLRGKEWGQDRETLRRIYVGYIRPVMEYGAQAWAPWASNTRLKSLDTTQNRALRSITGLARTCPIDILRLENNLPPITTRLERASAICWDRLRRREEGDPLSVMARAENLLRLKTRQGWRKQALDIIPEEIQSMKYSTTPTVPTEQWRTTTSQMKVWNMLIEPVLKTDPPDKRRIAAEKTIEERGDWQLYAYTDGSVAEGGRNGGAGVYVIDRHNNIMLEISTPAGALSSSMDAETKAMIDALRWKKQYHQEETMLVLSDSLSLVECLGGDNTKNTNTWVQDAKDLIAQSPVNTIGIQWVPSHCGLAGNEKADALAREGSTKDQSEEPVPIQATKAAIQKAIGWTITHERARQIFATRRSPNTIESTWDSEKRRKYVQLRSGHSTLLAQYRRTIGLQEDATCRWCREIDSEETITHIITECHALASKRLLAFGNAYPPYRLQ